MADINNQLHEAYNKDKEKEREVAKLKIIENDLMKSVEEIHESYLERIDNLKEENDLEISKLKEVNDLETSRLKELNDLELNKLKEETRNKEIDIGNRMLNTIEDLTQEMEGKMSERDKKQAQVLGSALKTLMRKPVKRTGAGEINGHNETCKYVEFTDLIGKTRLASAYDDSEWLFDLTREYNDNMIEKAKDVKRIKKRSLREYKKRMILVLKNWKMHSSNLLNYWECTS